MLINEIPDDCLLIIFDYIYNLEDLLNCYKVCVKWSYLIAKRTKKTKYLIGKIRLEDPGYSSDTVYYSKPCLIDSTCLSELFTNLIIADLAPRLHRKVEDAIEFVNKQKSLKGLINLYDEPIEKYCDQLEMLSVFDFNPNNLRNGSSLKQLDVRAYTSSLEALGRDAHYFPNLERLKIQIHDSDNRYDGPALEKLKILEMACRRPRDSIFYGFQLMDSCPNLQSAHILMNAHTSFFNETLTHKCLQDLVLQFYGLLNADDTWNYFKRVLVKYPNLKHLALRGYCIITDEHIEELVHILPNLVLLDVRECQEVTQEAADYVKDHCERNGRSIKFYFNGNRDEIDSDWPQLSSKYEIISRGFDFMKHCFLKDWTSDGPSPLLIPIGY